MIFSVEQFERFCLKLRIDSKEYGQIPFKWSTAQRYFVEEIAKGLNEGVHTFFVLKARQLGISTICLALDLYWLFLHKGLQGALVLDSDENRVAFKATLTQYHDTLPAGARVAITEHNKVQLVLKNRSRLSYITAGKRKNEALGAGKAVNFLHGTECAVWGDEEGFKSLIATLAQQNPNRLYIFESTAYGYNMWYELCEQAKKSKSERFIFIGWWRHNLYRWERGTAEFNRYWDGSPTSEEMTWMREVFEEYHINITPEQLAWWRWALDDVAKGDLNSMYQMYPPTAHYAFQMTGSKFFSGERVNIAYKVAREQEAPQFHRYRFGVQYEQMQFVETNEENAEARIWEMPQEGARYVMGADPAYGSSEWADRFAISIWRCFADKMVQVAEVCTPDWTPAQFAWALAHLGGSYFPCMYNLELQGPGEVVFNELNNLRLHSAFPSQEASGNIYKPINGIRDFLWKKADSMHAGYAMQSRNTSSGQKVTLMETLRSYFERDALIIRSEQCLEEFRHVSRDGDKISGEGRAKDDLAIAAALAVMAWDRWVKNEMRARNQTYALEMAPKGERRVISPVERAFSGYLQRQGIRRG